MRGKRAPKRKIMPDPKFNNLVVAKFINSVMSDGKKSTAQKVVYDALEIIEEKVKKDALEVFEQAIKNIAPDVEVKSRRVGGGNYQVPVAVVGDRKTTLAFRWILKASRTRKGAAMKRRLADELVAAYNKEGAAYKKREDVYRMAESNRAFAHFIR